MGSTERTLDDLVSGVGDVGLGGFWWTPMMLEL